jgi:hypothetical protein
VGAYCVSFPIGASDEYLDRGFNGAPPLGTNVMTASVPKPIVPRLDEWCQKYKMKLGLHNHWLGTEPCGSMLTILATEYRPYSS